MSPLKDRECKGQPSLSGRCFCGALTWRCAGPILWAAICHCDDCRRAASSDFVSWFGVNGCQLSWCGPRSTYKSSSRVVRSFCTNCGAPASFETEVFPDEVHLYAASLDQPEKYRPAAHIFWSERVAWSAVSDDLPKHQKGLQNAADSGVAIIERKSEP